MKRSRRSQTRAFTKFERVSGTRSVSTTNSIESMDTPKMTHKITKIDSQKLKQSSLKSTRHHIKEPRKVTLVKFQSLCENGLLIYKCYNESDILHFSKGVKNKVKTLSEDFDIESDDDTITNAAKDQEMRILKTFTC